jgi:hypothetical protein
MESMYYEMEWWMVGGSNPRPPHCERGALPAELTTHSQIKCCRIIHDRAVAVKEENVGEMMAR